MGCPQTSICPPPFEEPYRRRPLGANDPERGQIILVVATAMLFVLLVTAALAIDYGNGLLQKRRLQNAADAAALAATQVLANGGSVGTAVSTAQTLVAANTGGAASLPYPGSGSGTGLTDGIDVQDGDVRVVLRRGVNTFFTSVIGVNSVDVSVRSRASVGPFGTLPMSIKRFSAGDTSIPLGTGGNPTTVTDYLRPALSSDITEWPSPLTAPAPVAAGYTSPDAYSPAVSGPVFAILGQDAGGNVSGGNDFHGFLAPDVRSVTQLVPTFYNGITSATSIQSLKGLQSAYYSGRGYPGPNPAVWDQIAVLNGTNSSQTVDAARKAYRRGDVVSAFVYNGTVYRKPEFELNIDGAVKSSSNIGPGGDILTFQITLIPSNGFISPGVQFTATGLEGWADWSFGSGSENVAYSLPVPGGNTTVTFQVSADSVVEGVRTALIKGYDSISGNYRTISATLVVGSTPSFSLSCSEGYKVIEQSSSGRFNLALQGWNSYPTNTVTAGTPQWYNTATPPVPVSAPSGITVTPDPSVQVRDGHSATMRVNVNPSGSADIGQWLLKIPVSDGTPSRDQEIMLTVQTILSGSGPSAGNTTSFVIVLGYVNVVVTYANNASSPNPSLDNNTLYGYVVSPLTPTPAGLSRGLGSRLTGWTQSR